MPQLQNGCVALKRAELTSKMSQGRDGLCRQCWKETLKTAIEEDVQHSVEEIGDLYGINSSAVFYILKEVLQLKKVCARWIPHLLTNEQRGGGRVEKASLLLARYKDADFRRLHGIVTGDETWLYFFEPDCKENNKVWICENGARP